MLAFLLFACGAAGELSVFPSSLDFGEVDFQLEMPEEGYGALTVALKNVGETDLDISVSHVDFDRLCLQGFTAEPIDLGTLRPNQSYSIKVGVCDYSRETGERDNLVSDYISIDHNGANSPSSIQWSFTPVENIQQ